MKTLIPYSLLAASGLALGAETAYTTPVGYVTIDVAPSSDSIVGPCLSRPAELETVAVSATGSTIKLKANGYAADAFTYAPAATVPQRKHYYILFRDGSLAGQFMPVISSAASDNNGTPTNMSDDSTVFTLESGVTISGTPRVAVIPFWTFDSLFPGGAGVGTQPDPGNTDQIVTFFDQSTVGANLGTSGNDTFSYYDGSQGGAAGWYNVISGNPAGDDVIENSQMMLVRNSSNVARSIVVTGEVPRETITSAVYREAVVQDNASPLRFPVDVSLAASGLCKATPNGLGGYTFSGPVSPVNDPGDTTGDSVLLYDYNPIGEDGTPTINGFNFNPTKTFVFYDGSQGGAAEWYSVDTGTPENPLLKPGRGLYIRKAAGTVAALPWVQPIPYTP